MYRKQGFEKKSDGNQMKQRGRLKKRYQLLLIASAFLLVVVLYLGLNWLEQQGRKPEERSDYTLRYAYEPTIEVDGKTYKEKDRLTTILLMGIDKETGARSFGYQNGGQADFLRLLVFDGELETVSQLQIDRDTMAPITILGITGKPAGTRNAQISLSHGFGDGGAQSCQLTVDAVSNLLSGVEIDFYMALNMDGIPVLNDWANGVEVTLTEDFSAADPAMVKGKTLTLMGKQAEIFVRGRMNVGEGTNLSRMQRQQVYVSGLVEKLKNRISADKEAFHGLLEQMEDYLLTDMTQGRIINEFWAAREYRENDLIQPAGEHVIGSDGFMEFLADEKDIRRIVLEIFYEEVK